MKAYKGFGKDMKCRDFQYAEGETYETDSACVCNCGFHACENPVDCLSYYSPGRSVYHEVEVDGKIDHSGDDTKVAATKIKIGARLSIAGLVKAAFDFVRSKCTNENNAEPGKAASAGSYGAASAGENGAASAGSYGAAVSRGSVEVGENGVGAVRAEQPKIKGGMGAMLTIARESNVCYDIVEWKSFVIDGKKYKADVWYTLRGGKIVEAEGGAK